MFEGGGGGGHYPPPSGEPIDYEGSLDVRQFTIVRYAVKQKRPTEIKSRNLSTVIQLIRNLI